MKVIIRDKRSNPRITMIDGRRYILPSNKEIVKDISFCTFNALKNCSWLEIREYKKEVVSDKAEESKQEDLGSIVEVVDEKLVELPKQENKEPVKVSLNEEQVEEVEEKKVDYSALTKRELRVMIEEKGGDTAGMSKANMIDWLKANT